MSMAPVIDYGTKRPLTDRINFRLLAVVVIFCALVGIPVYNYIKIQTSHGVEKVGDVYHVDLKSMGFFNFNEFTGTAQDIPPQFRKLDGKEVSLEGFIYSPEGAGSKLTSFQFVYNITKCCFSGPPLVQERVFARVPADAPVDYLPDEVRIFGTLHVSLQKDEATGKILSVYTMDVKRVEPLY